MESPQRAESVLTTSEHIPRKLSGQGITQIV